MIMTADLTHILIFRTNIHTPSDKLRVGEFFTAHRQVQEWNVDMEDVDRVLRIVSHDLRAADIIRHVNTIGYECQELD